MGYNNIILTQRTARVKMRFSKNGEFLADFQEKSPKGS